MIPPDVLLEWMNREPYIRIHVKGPRTVVDTMNGKFEGANLREAIEVAILSATRWCNLSRDLNRVLSEKNKK